MTMPAVYAEIAFVTDFNTGAPLWDDVSQWVEWQNGVRISRRRSHELDEVQPGTMALTLLNTDGRFTAGNTGSPYYARVIINRPIRIRARHPMSANRLLEAQAKATSLAGFGASQGTLALEAVIVAAGQTSSIAWSAGTLASANQTLRLGASGLSTPGGESFSVAAGQTWSFSGQVRRDASVAVSVTARIRWYGRNSAFLSETAGTAVALSTTFQALTVSATAPAGAYFARATIGNTTTTASAVIIYAGALQLEQAAAPSTWVSPGVEYVRYVGYVDRWPHAWTNGVLGRAEVSATDVQKLLGRQNVSISVVERTTLATKPVCYYPCSEPDGATVAANHSESAQSGAAITQYGSGGTARFGQKGAPAGATGIQLTPVNQNNGWGLSASPLITPLGGTSAITIAGWAQPTAPPDVDYDEIVVAADDGSDGFANWIRCGYNFHFGWVALRSTITGAASGGWIGTIPLQVDIPHLFVGVFELSGGTLFSKLYLDTALIINQTSSATISVFPQLKRFLAGGFASWGPDLWFGTISHAAAWNRVLTPTEINSLYASRTALKVSGTHIADLLTDAGITQFAVDAGRSTLDLSGIGEQSFLAAIKQAESSEAGLFYCARDGTATFHDRLRRQVPQATAISLTADQCGPDLSFQVDDQLLINDVSVARVGGAATRATDANSIGTYGRYTKKIDTRVSTDTDTVDRASFVLRRYAQPVPRAGQITVEAASLGSMWPQLLSSEIDQRIDVTGLPAQAPSSSISQWVEGVQEMITDQTWHFTFDTSPVLTQTSVILDDAVTGLLDSNYLGW